MRQLLDLDNPVLRFILHIFDCMVLSVLFVLFSLPIFTIGAASTALYAAVYTYIRMNRSYLWRSFWKAFKENFKRSTLAWLPMLAMILFLGYDVLALRALIVSGVPLGRLYGVILVLLCVAGVWAIYLAAYCARFTGGVKDVLQFSFFLMMSHPLYSIGVMAALLVTLLAIATVPGLAALLPAVCFWIASGLIEPVFRKHLRPEDAQRIQEEEAQP